MKQPWRVRITIYLVIILGLVFALSNFKPFSSESIFTFNFKEKSLSTIFQSTPKTSGTYAFYIESLSSGEKFGYQENTPMPAASLYKLYLVAAVYKEIAEGRLKLEETLSASKDYLTRELGSVDSGYEDRPSSISYTVEEALIRIGRISDNFAAIMLIDKIGLDKIKQTVAELGAKNTNFEGDLITTSVADIAGYFKQLYRGEIVSREVSDSISKILEISVINDRIPANLPKEIEIIHKPSSNKAGYIEKKPLKIIHKTGELSGIRNDAGIVFLESHPYVIVIMSKDLKREDEGVTTLAEISKRFYDYFSSELN